LKQKAPYLIQVWILPGIILPKILTLCNNPLIVMRTVRTKKFFENDKQWKELNVSLIEMEGTGRNMFEPTEDLSFLRGYLLKLSFSWMENFAVVSARVIPRNLTVGQEFEELLFTAPPAVLRSSMGLFEFNEAVKLDPAFLRQDIPDKVESAISWFLKGLSSSNPLDQVSYNWVGLEVLAPIIQEHWYCDNCKNFTRECLNCQKSTLLPKAVKTMRSYLEGAMGLTRKEFNALYKLRNEISHGMIKQTSKVNPDTIKKVHQIQQLLLAGIKRSLDWATEALPTINPQWNSHEGKNEMIEKRVFPGDYYYQIPSGFFDGYTAYDLQILSERK